MSCLLATAVACSSSSSSSSSSTPTAAAASGPNWHQFTVTKQDQPGFTTLSSVEEMQSTGGFTFTFPSYLPAGMSTSMAVDAAAQTSSADNSVTYGPAEEVMIFRGTPDGPHITIQEQTPPVSLTYASIASSDKAVQTELAGQPVWCIAEDVANGNGTNPGLKCVYYGVSSDMSGRREGRAFAFLFQWKVDTPVPGLVSDAQRQEAFKVITSTIQAPAYW